MLFPLLGPSFIHLRPQFHFQNFKNLIHKVAPQRISYENLLSFKEGPIFIWEVGSHSIGVVPFSKVGQIGPVIFWFCQLHLRCRSLVWNISYNLKRDPHRTCITTWPERNGIIFPLRSSLSMSLRRKCFIAKLMAIAKYFCLPSCNLLGCVFGLRTLLEVEENCFSSRFPSLFAQGPRNNALTGAPF